MLLPGFSADNSLYRSANKYVTVADSANRITPEIVEVGSIHTPYSVTI
jgi:hypothetical protein